MDIDGNIYSVQTIRDECSGEEWRLAPFGVRDNLIFIR